MIILFFPIPLLCRWKVDESCMLAVGSIQPLISEKVSKAQLQFDIPGFLSEVVLPALDTSGNPFTSRSLFMMKSKHCTLHNDVWLVFTASPFLIGRALWFSSRFTHEMPPELLARLRYLIFFSYMSVCPLCDCHCVRDL